VRAEALARSLERQQNGGVLKPAKLGGKDAPANPYETMWTGAPLRAGRDAHSVSVDLSSASYKGATVHAVKYAWPMGDDGDTCCPQVAVTGQNEERVSACIPGSCPIFSKSHQLPANPFFAAVTVTGAGKCKCGAPQVYDA
jgi:hypothetical protein